MRFQWLAGLPNLVYLDLSNSNITTFPPGICPHLKHLKTLIMNAGRVESLPSDFSDLKHLKTLYRHDINSLSLTVVDRGKAYLRHDVTDSQFERMKRELTQNGTVSIQFLCLIFPHFGFNSHHYELLVNLLFKFDLPVTLSTLATGSQDCISSMVQWWLCSSAYQPVHYRPSPSPSQQLNRATT